MRLRPVQAVEHRRAIRPTGRASGPRRCCDPTRAPALRRVPGCRARARPARRCPTRRRLRAPSARRGRAASGSGRRRSVLRARPRCPARRCGCTGLRRCCQSHRRRLASAASAPCVRRYSVSTPRRSSGLKRSISDMTEAMRARHGCDAGSYVVAVCPARRVRLLRLLRARGAGVTDAWCCGRADRTPNGFDRRAARTPGAAVAGRRRRPASGSSSAESVAGEQVCERRRHEPRSGCRTTAARTDRAAPGRRTSPRLRSLRLVRHG